MKRLFWPAVLLVALGAFWLFTRSRPVQVDLGGIERGPVRASVEEEGRTQVVDRFVVSAPVEGRLRRIGLEEGDAVKKGDVVAALDPLPLQSRVEESEARLDALRHRLDGVATRKPKPEELERAKVLEQRARDALKVAQRDRDAAAAEDEKLQKDLVRARSAVRTDTGTPAELDAAEAAAEQARERLKAAEIQMRIRELDIEAAALDTAILTARLGDYAWEEKDYRAQIAALEATLKALRDDLQRTEVHAPVDGVVLRVLQESEQAVAAGTPVLELGDVTKLEVIADFLSEDAAHMREGMKAELFGRALGDRVIPATIKRIHPSAYTKISSLGVEQQRVDVLFDFDAAKAPLGDRYRVEVRVILDERADAVLVPEGALFRLGEAWHVFVATTGDRARLRAVETGLRDGRAREVLEGLEPGERVVLHPPDDLEDGAPLEPLR